VAGEVHEGTQARGAIFAAGAHRVGTRHSFEDFDRQFRAECIRGSPVWTYQLATFLDHLRAGGIGVNTIFGCLPNGIET